MVNKLSLISLCHLERLICPNAPTQSSDRGPAQGLAKRAGTKIAARPVAGNWHARSKVPRDQVAAGHRRQAVHFDQPMYRCPVPNGSEAMLLCGLKRHGQQPLSDRPTPYRCLRWKLISRFQALKDMPLPTSEECQRRLVPRAVGIVHEQEPSALHF